MFDERCHGISQIRTLILFKYYDVHVEVSRGLCARKQLIKSVSRFELDRSEYAVELIIGQAGPWEEVFGDSPIIRNVSFDALIDSILLKLS